MDVQVFCKCALVLDDLFRSPDVKLDEFNLERDAPSFLKVLEYSAIIDLGEADELPVVVIRGIKELSKPAARLIVRIRNSNPFNTLSLADECFVYKTLSKIYRK